MIEPKDLSISDLKKMHKGVREKIECVKEPTNGERNMFFIMENGQNRAEGLFVLRMLDEEFDRRGYDPTKLFKGYEYSNYLTTV